MSQVHEELLSSQRIAVADCHSVGQLDGTQVFVAAIAPRVLGVEVLGFKVLPPSV